MTLAFQVAFISEHPQDLEIAAISRGGGAFTPRCRSYGQSFTAVAAVYGTAVVRAQFFNAGLTLFSIWPVFFLLWELW
jgi:hypothetical protein